MKILLTGKNGQLGQALAQVLLLNNYDFYAPARHILDLCDVQAMYRYLQANPVDFWINTAAYTDVNTAETETALAHKINAESLQHIAQICREMQIFLIHISTDYVFDGQSAKPYSENSTPNPLNSYGLSKLLGEFNILNAQIPSIILRTSWVYSSTGRNFFLSMTKLLQERARLTVVNDQIGAPSYTLDIAQAIVQLLQKPDLLPKSSCEILHFSNQGEISWYDFASQIQRKLNYINCQLLPITTAEYPSPARRPLFSVLDCSKIASKFSIIPRHWKQALDDACIDFLRAHL